MSVLIETILPCGITSTRFIPWAILLETLLLAALWGSQTTGTGEQEAGTFVPTSIPAPTVEPIATTEERGAVDKVVGVKPGGNDHVDPGPYYIQASAQDCQESSSFTLNASTP